MSGPARAGVISDPPKVKVGPPKDVKVTGEQLKQILPKNVYEYLQNDEKKKYIKCWESDAYRKVSPGERLVDLFIESAKPNKGVTLVDWGCGTGRAAKKLHEYGLDVTAVDFAPNCLDPEAKALAKEKNNNFRFIEHDITKKISLPSEYGFCTDFLEHIPEEQINDALDTILDNSRHVFFQIATCDDVMGAHPDIINDDGEREHLHLTVHNYQWWLEKFASKKVVIHHSADKGNSVLFYLTGWGTAPLKWDNGVINTFGEIMKENMIENAKLGIQQARPYESQESEVMLLCGGPTLNDFEDDIREKKEEGIKIVTVNGAYNWTHERNLWPVTQCMIDAREFNKKFVTPVDDKNIYFIASQCHPEVFKDLPKDRTYLWQVTIDEEFIPTIKECYGEMYEDWYPCPGGSTVSLRALCLLRMLGFHKIHVYGLDSCLFEDRDHHAYEQKENDKIKPMHIIAAPGTKYARRFKCAGWQVYQAKEFLLMTPRVLHDCKLKVYGDGLIAYLIEAAAEMKSEQVGVAECKESSSDLIQDSQ